MTRLDVYLKDHFKTRTKAQDAIKEGRIKVNDIVITKPGFDITQDDKVDIEQSSQKYVSRAAYKLLAAFNTFKIDIRNQVVLDIGASTGGFTQICLEQGAKKVYALDVGHLQLDADLEKDPRIVKMEGYNARYIDPNDFEEDIDFICMDVSFISSRTILEPLLDKISFKHIAFLIKPQFECGPHALDKHGVLRNKKIEEQIVIDLKRYMMRYFRQVQTIKSPIKGRQGNQEYVLYAKEAR